LPLQQYILQYNARSGSNWLFRKEVTYV
jgi:hypothetical protein